jgi:hypothetical protein
MPHWAFSDMVLATAYAFQRWRPLSHVFGQAGKSREPLATNLIR